MIYYTPKPEQNQFHIQPLNAIQKPLNNPTFPIYPVRKLSFLFPSDNKNGCITNATVYDFYYRMCKNLGIATGHEFTKGTHAFRRTRITEVANKSGGNLIMASQLFGNSPEVAKKHYYTGIDLQEAKRVLES